MHTFYYNKSKRGWRGRTSCGMCAAAGNRKTRWEGSNEVDTVEAVCHIWIQQEPPRHEKNRHRAPTSFETAQFFCISMKRKIAVVVHSAECREIFLRSINYWVAHRLSLADVRAKDITHSRRLHDIKQSSNAWLIRIRTELLRAYRFSHLQGSTRTTGDGFRRGTNTTISSCV